HEFSAGPTGKSGRAATERVEYRHVPLLWDFSNGGCRTGTAEALGRILHHHHDLFPAAAGSLRTRRTSQHVEGFGTADQSGSGRLSDLRTPPISRASPMADGKRDAGLSRETEKWNAAETRYGRLRVLACGD